MRVDARHALGFPQHGLALGAPNEREDLLLLQRAEGDHALPFHLLLRLLGDREAPAVRDRTDELVGAEAEGDLGDLEAARAEVDAHARAARAEHARDRRRRGAASRPRAEIATPRGICTEVDTHLGTDLFAADEVGERAEREEVHVMQAASRSRAEIRAGATRVEHVERGPSRKSARRRAAS